MFEKQITLLYLPKCMFSACLVRSLISPDLPHSVLLSFLCILATSTIVSPIEIVFGNAKRRYRVLASEHRASMRRLHPESDFTLDPDDMGKLFVQAMDEYIPTFPSTFRKCGIDNNLAKPGILIVPKRVADTRLPFGVAPVGAPLPPGLPKDVRERILGPSASFGDREKRIKLRISNAKDDIISCRRDCVILPGDATDGADSKQFKLIGIPDYMCHSEHCTDPSTRISPCLAPVLLYFQRRDWQSRVRDMVTAEPVSASEAVAEERMSDALHGLIAQQNLELERVDGGDRNPDHVVKQFEAAADAIQVPINVYFLRDQSGSDNRTLTFWHQFEPLPAKTTASELYVPSEQRATLRHSAKRRPDPQSSLLPVWPSSSEQASVAEDPFRYTDEDDDSGSQQQSTPHESRGTQTGFGHSLKVASHLFIVFALQQNSMCFWTAQGLPFFICTVI